MFGYVTANLKELNPEQKQRYQGVYCGICRQIRSRANQLSRLGLSFDMAFLALLLMSLYEPEEQLQEGICAIHPFKKRQFVDSEYIVYAAEMNVALAYYQAADDWQDDRKLTAKWMTGVFGKNYPSIAEKYPRQCQAIADCIGRLSALEKENCANADEPANCFGQLMGELLVYREDLWAPTLRRMGMALGRFIYLADAAVDYRRDKRGGKYNPYLAMGMEENWSMWEDCLVLAMGKCTEEFEKLPLVQDKKLLDEILYSGVWSSFARMKKEGAKDGHDSRSV